MPSLSQNIIQLLIQKGVLTAEKLKEASNLHKKDGGRFSSLLVGKNYVKKETLLEFINTNLSMPIADTSDIKITRELSRIISQNDAKKYHILPISLEGKELVLGVADLLSIFDLDEIKEIEGYNITPRVIPQIRFVRMVDELYSPKGPSGPIADVVKGLPAAAPNGGLPRTEKTKAAELERLTEAAPIIKSTDSILERAVAAKASDVLIEPMEKTGRIRFRLDGVFHHIENVSSDIQPLIVSRIKVISNLDISEHRMPQDGQFKMRINEKDVEFRVSIFPNMAGEKAAIRILDKSSGMLDIDKLGFRDELLNKLKEVAQLPHGMILVCGPTGSGKTSTLYSILKYIHTPEKNLITVEDPVEYRLKGVSQVAVNTKVGLTFGRSLRSILRQDPDIIMIGEIRDFETVDIAIKAALTGHLLLSTLHTTTTAGSIVRLVDMGVEPFLINACLVCVIAQRLARRICEHCKEKIPGLQYFRGKGCNECFNTGYAGRVLIPEILYMSPAIRQAVAERKFEEIKIKELACKEGMRSLRQEGEYLALKGITTEEEVLRVTPAD